MDENRFRFARALPVSRVPDTDRRSVRQNTAFDVIGDDGSVPSNRQLQFEILICKTARQRRVRLRRRGGKGVGHRDVGHLSHAKRFILKRDGM